MGRGKMMVEFFSDDMVLSVCRYRSWSAVGDSMMMSAAAFRARDAFCSPSAEMTCKMRWMNELMFNNDNVNSITVHVINMVNHL